MDQSELTVYFYDVFDASLPRLGPGEDSLTRKAIDLLRAAKPQRMNPPDSPGLRILDLGCGNGARQSSWQSIWTEPSWRSTTTSST